MRILCMVRSFVLSLDIGDVRRGLLVTCLILLSSGVGCRSRQNDDWWRLIAQAQLSTDRGEHEKAATTLTLAIAECPDESPLPLAYFRRAQIYLHQNLLDAAIQDCTDAILIGPPLSEVYELRGCAYEKKGLGAQAICDFGKAIDLDKGKPTPYVRRAALLAAAGNSQGAMDDLALALLIDPANHLAYFHRSKVYAERGRRDLAIQDLSRAIDVEPDEATYYGHRGDLYADRGDFSGKSEQYEEAIEDYTTYVGLRPDDTLGYIRRGLVFLSSGREEDALHDFNRALQIEPACSDAYYGRGHVYYAQGKYDMAMKEYDHALGIKPDSGWFQQSRGMALEALGLHEKALGDFAEAKRLAPDSPTPHFLVGWTRYNMGEFRAAYEDLRKATDLASGQEGKNIIPYAHLYLVLSDRRAGILEPTGFQELPASHVSAKHRDWFEKLQAFFAGRITEDALVEAAQGAKDEQKRQRQLCEAFFYAGTFRILDGDIPEGRRLLERSVATHAFDVFEYTSATHELKRIQQDTP